jgi:hypothetical protein
MVRFETRSFYSELPRQLNRDSGAGVEAMDVAADTENALQVNPADRPTGLSVGPYGVSPLCGLHFDAPDDTAAS